MDAQDSEIPGWYKCSECGSLCATKSGAEDCCKGRHNRTEKKVYQPQSKKPNTWV